MLRSLHLKLMLIMLLLITSLMTVVGAFLMTNVTSFYTDAFYSQMKAVFDESNTGFVQSLRMEAAGDDGAARLQTMIEVSAGSLGIDSRTRNYYILDAKSGKCLASSDTRGGDDPPISWLHAMARWDKPAISPPTTWMWPSPSAGATTISSFTFWITAKT